MSFEIQNNICEICGEKASAGIIDNDYKNDGNNQIRIRYSCQNHYLQVYKRIKEEERTRK
jgi:hypothetical protein